MIKYAVFSEKMTYRYALHRSWDHNKDFVCFIGLNPSTADDQNDDPTIRRLIKYCEDWGYGGFFIVNLFALVTADPKLMMKHPSPIGKKNDRHIRIHLKKCKLTVLMWGRNGTFSDRYLKVLKLLGKKRKLHCFDLTKERQPKHPLFLKSDLLPKRIFFHETVKMFSYLE